MRLLIRVLRVENSWLAMDANRLILHGGSTMSKHNLSKLTCAIAALSLTTMAEGLNQFCQQLDASPTDCSGIIKLDSA